MKMGKTKAISDIMDGIAKHLSYLPKAEREKRIKSAASYRFKPKRVTA